VYDIEVNTNHNFMANDILVHNSNYLVLDGVLTHIGAQHLDDRKKTEILDRFASEKIEPLLTKTFEKLASDLHCKTNKIVMKREGIASRSIWTAKKRYAQRIFNSEGVDFDPPKIKIMGIEAVRSSTPPACRTLIKDAITIMLSEGEVAVQKFVATKYEQFIKLDLLDIACPRTANNLDKYSDPQSIYTKGCPKHVRASLMYNKLLKDKNLVIMYEKIASGDKMKFVHLKMPNPTHENVIGFSNFLPAELGLQEYIDYDAQFQDNFITPLQNILSAAGWNVKETNTLESFFG